MQRCVSALTGRGLKDPAEKVELISVTGEKLPGDYMFVRELKMGGIVLEQSSRRVRRCAYV